MKWVVGVDRIEYNAAKVRLRDKLNSLYARGLVLQEQILRLERKRQRYLEARKKWSVGTQTEFVQIMHRRQLCKCSKS